MDTETKNRSKIGSTNLLQRLVVGFIAGPLIFFGTIYSKWFFISIMLILLIFALREIYALINASGEIPLYAPGWAFGLAIFTAFVFCNLHCMFSLLILGVMIFGAGMIIRENGSGVFGAALTFFWTLYISAGIGCLFLIREYNWQNLVGSDIVYAGGRVASLVFILLWTLDTAAYFLGKRFGKRPLMKRISPKKTIMGSIGGGVCTIVVTIIAHYTYIQFIPLLHMLSIGILIGIAGQIGDLIESSFKRKANIKDSSSVIPGHGGVLDRFDSLFFAAPIVYFYIIFVI